MGVTFGFDLLIKSEMLIFERVFEKGVINKKLKKSSWKNKGGDRKL